jgi:hypothetical protein
MYESNNHSALIQQFNQKEKKKVHFFFFFLCIKSHLKLAANSMMHFKSGDDAWFPTKKQIQKKEKLKCK